MAQAKKRKKFFDVEIPLVGKTTHLQAFELKELDGKILKYDLTRILRGKSILANFKIKTENEKAIASPTELKLMPYAIRRMVRKGTNYVEDSILTKCKDAEIIVKPFLITRRKVSREVRKALRNRVEEEIEAEFKTKTFEKLFDEILKNSVQKSISLKLKKTYPLSACEIRVLKVKKFLEKEK